MKHPHRIKQWLWYVTGIVFFISLPLPFVMEAVGFYTLHPGWEVAEMLVEKGKSVVGCRKIYRAFWWDVLSPPQSEQRSLCIFRYANLTKDPTACALIMPSGYGLSCINQSMDLAFKESSDPKAEHVDIHSDCSSYSSSVLRQDYCFFEKAHLTKKTSDCNVIQNETIHKACIMKFEAWEKYPELRKSTYFGIAAEE